MPVYCLLEPGLGLLPTLKSAQDKKPAYILQYLSFCVSLAGKGLTKNRDLAPAVSRQGIHQEQRPGSSSKQARD